MNYNNFKRHDYRITWHAYKNDDGTYSKIVMIFTRDFDWPKGDVVTDIFEVKYVCKKHHFDFNDLEIDENGDYVIKNGSTEWEKYLNDPGIPAFDYVRASLGEPSMIVNIPLI